MDSVPSDVDLSFRLRTKNANRWCAFSALPQRFVVHPNGIGEPAMEVSWQGVANFPGRLCVFGLRTRFDYPNRCRGVRVLCRISDDQGDSVEICRKVTPQESVVHFAFVAPLGNTIDFTLQILPLEDAVDVFYSQLELFDFSHKMVEGDLSYFESSANRTQEKCLILCAAGGLSNRLLALVSAMRICKNYCRRLIVLWPNNENCTASLDEIFGTFVRLPTFEMPSPLKQADLNGFSTIASIDQSAFEEDNVFVAAGSLWTTSEFDSSIVDRLPTWCGELKDVFFEMQPDETLWSRARADTTCRIANSVAVHVRLPRRLESDSVASHWEKQLFDRNREFGEQLTGILLGSGSQTVSLFTHDSDFLEAMYSKFGDAVTFLTKESDSSGASTGASQDAFVDILAMSRFPVIVSQAPSGFGFFAFLIGRGCLVYLHETSTTNSHGHVVIESYDRSLLRTCIKASVADVPRACRQMIEAQIGYGEDSKSSNEECR